MKIIDKFKRLFGIKPKPDLRQSCVERYGEEFGELYMDKKDLLMSISELHSAMTDAHIHAITTILVEKMRENMETMLPAFPFNDDKERQVSIERALIVYEMGIKDGINEWLKTNNYGT